MKKYLTYKIAILIIILTLCLTLFSILVKAEVPKIVPYVNDFANVLTPEEINNLNIICDSIEKNTGYEIAIVTVKNTEGLARIDYANKIGDLNGVGKKGQSNGLVVLWSMDSEKGGAISTGRGSESVFNDAKVGRIGRASRPYFDNESYYEGFKFILNELNKEINTPTNSSVTNSSSDSNDYSGMILIGIIAFALIFILIPILSNIFDSDDDSSYSSGRIIGSFSSSHSSSGSSFSGGRSFGGGSFSGGGASW